MKIEGIFAGKGVATEPTREAGTTMEQRASEECEDCLWWYEDDSLCLECRNNPKANEGHPSEEKGPLTSGKKGSWFCCAGDSFRQVCRGLCESLGGMETPLALRGVSPSESEGGIR